MPPAAAKGVTFRELLMDRAKFQKVLRAYGLDDSEVYCDLSAIGLHLWHNEESNVGLSMEAPYPKWEPCLIFTLLEDGVYYFGSKPRVDINRNTLERLLGSLRSGKYVIAPGDSGSRVLSILSEQSKCLLSIVCCE